MKERFDELFGDLYIGSHPTPERNKYLILTMNFAAIHADLDNYKGAMDRYCDINFYYFCRKYAALLSPDIQQRLKEKGGAVDQLECICTECQSLGLKLYLLIDEYDHFTSKILSHPDALERYREETHGEGYIRKFYDVIKKCYGKTTMYNSNMVLYFIDHYRRNLYDIPKNMIDDNIRFDYEKIRMFIRKDKEFAHDASIIQQLVQVEMHTTSSPKTSSEHDRQQR